MGRSIASWIGAAIDPPSLCLLLSGKPLLIDMSR